MWHCVKTCTSVNHKPQLVVCEYCHFCRSLITCVSTLCEHMHIFRSQFTWLVQYVKTCTPNNHNPHVLVCEHICTVYTYKSRNSCPYLWRHKDCLTKPDAITSCRPKGNMLSQSANAFHRLTKKILENFRSDENCAINL